jgi:hypothetical protein
MSNMPCPSIAPVPPRPRAPRWFTLKLLTLLGGATWLSACSFLIEVGDGTEEAEMHLASWAPSETPPAIFDPTPPRPVYEVVPDDGAPEDDMGADLGSDAGAPLEPGAPDATPPLQPEPEPPTFDLAFIEDPEESDATLRLVSSSLALEGSADASTWRRTLLAAQQSGDALDFAWSPDGQRLALRYAAVTGPRIAVFAAPDWTQLETEEALAPATLPDLTPTARYRWAPDGQALAVELAGDGAPFVGGYVIDGARAIGIPPIEFTGPIETLGWRSSDTLYVIQPEDEEPEIVALSLGARAFESQDTVFAVALFFPLELRPVAGGLVAGSDDPTNFLYFWPQSAEGFQTTFRPEAFTSSRQRFVAEPDEISGTALYPIADTSQPLDTLPDCPVVLAWAEGPDPSSLAGARVACLNVADATATLSVHSYDAGGAPSVVTLDDEILRGDFSVLESWEAHARGFSPSGEWLVLATSTRDVLIDLRGAEPVYHVTPAEVGNSAAGFSPSGRQLIQQRGRDVRVTVLAPSAAPSRFEPLRSALDLEACSTAHHAASFCGSPAAARSAAARWSIGSDVAAMPIDGEGLALLATDGATRLRSRDVSTCGAGCVKAYEFGL